MSDAGPDNGVRALRALIDAAQPSADSDDEDVPVAATVVIVRDGDAGAEVLMIKRPDRGSFAAAWVFPGGKLEPGDSAGGAGDDPMGAARRAGVRETAEETGLILDAAALVPLSHWDPPPGLQLRIRTWFFLAADPGGPIALAADEVVASSWAHPGEMLERHGRGELTLYPPTWVTLRTLAELSLGGAGDVADLLAAVRMTGIRSFETRAARGPSGPMLLWDGDAGFADGTVAAEAAARHRLDVSNLPWIYERTV